MSTVYCQKLKKEAQALVAAPIPGPLGEKILNNISQQAWQLWLAEQTMLINENQLTLTDPNARALLVEKMQAFLFEDEDVRPDGFKS